MSNFSEPRNVIVYVCLAATAVLGLESARYGSLPPRSQSAPSASTDYYLDSAAGSDDNAGTTIDHAWKTLARVNATTFHPGDHILFKSGGVWTGQLWPKGSGDDQHPIIIDKYGGDALPVINGAGLAEDAVLLKNQEYWEIRHLEVTNTGSTSAVRRGVDVVAENVGELHHIHLQNLAVHDVNGSFKEKANGGIHYRSIGDIKPSRFVDLRIENNHIWHVDRSGIFGWSTHWTRAKWYPSLGVAIRHNVLNDIGGDGIVNVATDGALVEYNVVSHASQRNQDYNDGIWPFSSDNTVVQYNEVYGMRGMHDAFGFDSDWNSRNTIIQYNYSHDNDGGFLLICNEGSQSPNDSAGNVGTIVRYNVSQNDHHRGIKLSGPVKNTLIYNNTIYAGKNEDIDFVLHTDWTGWASDTYFYNNIFYAEGTARFGYGVTGNDDGSYVSAPGPGKSTNNVYDYNVYYGVKPMDDPHALTADPLLVKPGSATTGLQSVGGYALRSHSPAIDSGKKIENSDGKDFAGTTVPQCGARDRGAFESRECSPRKKYFLSADSRRRHRGAMKANVCRISKKVMRLCCTALVFCAGVCWADPTLSTLFSDHMVLQQGREIHVWGKADPSEQITVSLAGHSAKATADAHGNWSLQLPAMRAGGPFTLSIRGKKEVVIRDVLIGEVWIASGQSNMTYSLEGSENGAAEVPKANHPQIRLFTVPRKISLLPQDNTLPAHWEICTPETARSFSAVAYYFAREIQRRLNIPVGIVESAWPGTAIQAWMSLDVLRADPELRPVANEWDRTTAADKKYADNPLPFDLEFDDFELMPVRGETASKALASFDDGTARLDTGGSFSFSWSDAPNAAFELVSPGRGGGGFAARVAGTLDGTQDSILSATYKSDGTALDLTSYAGLRFWVRGNGSFRFRSKQATISDYDDYATPLVKATSEWSTITVPFRDLRQDGWGVVKDFTLDALTGFSIECLTSLEYAPMPVSGLYEGMITPLLPYRFRGALWYQGESNAMQAHQYRKLLPAMIQNWREASKQNDLEFLIVQLPNHGAIPEEPSESAWSELREAELMTAQRVPHTGLAVTIDVGDPKDLHPPRKMEVGERLALWALGTTYQQPIEYSGPLYESMQIQGGNVRLHFTHMGTGLEAHEGPELRGFAVAGADRKFHWADAHIEGSTVVVSSRDVPSPAAVRYAWGDSPRCNLFNRDGLPASPFRTDDWPGITDGK